MSDIDATIDAMTRHEPLTSEGQAMLTAYLIGALRPDSPTPDSGSPNVG